MNFDKSKVPDTNRIIERIILNATGLKFINDSGKLISKPYGQTIQLNFFRIASLNWCKLYGSDSQEHHWKKIITETYHKDFRKQLYEDLNVTEDEYKSIREKIKCFRDNHTSHKEVYPVDIPCLTQPLVACGTLGDVINGNNWFNEKLELARVRAKEQLSPLLID